MVGGQPEASLSSAGGAAELLAIIPDVGRILEIATGHSGIAEACKARNPLCEYVAIIADEAAAAVVQQSADKVLIGPFEDLDDQLIAGDGTFGLIILGDMLEHDSDGERLLAKALRLLAPGGHVAISAANSAHWRAIAELLAGGPADGGLGSKSGRHRKFTATSLANMLAGAGLSPIKRRAKSDAGDHPASEKWLSALGDLADRVGIARNALVERSRVSHFNLLAGRRNYAPSERLYLVTAAAVPEFMEVRTRLPALALDRVPWVTSMYQERGFRLPLLAPESPRILVIQRPQFDSRAAWKAMIDNATALGWLVVLEFDDHPELIARIHRKPVEWRQFAGSHAVQTTTDGLAAAFREHNDDVAVFPNTAFKLAPARDRAGPPRQVFFGALNRGPFGVEIARSLAPAIAAHPDCFFHVAMDRAFFDALPTSRKSFAPKLDHDGYLAALAAADIALLPLAGQPFEEFKSDLKFVEAASQGAAVIASPAVYGSTVEHGRTGLIAADVPAWAPALQKLFKEDGLCRTLGSNARAHVRDRRMFTAQVDKRIAWYRSLWDERERLQTRLIARCPWLAA